jgi:hypothetical protein
MNIHKIVSNNESSKNTNVNPEINNLSTNKISHFLENIVPINETLEQPEWLFYS